MVFRIISYIKFLLKSTNRHGVHSPFVYNYITKCIYGQKKLHKDKFVNLVLKSYVYFNPSQIDTDLCSPSLQNNIQKNIKNLSDQKSNYNMICWQNPSHNFNIVDPNTIVIINNIRKSAQQFSRWNALKMDDSVTVSIDFFSQGVLFFRKEQEKQHFVIRS